MFQILMCSKTNFLPDLTVSTISISKIHSGWVIRDQAHKISGTLILNPVNIRHLNRNWELSYVDK